MKTINIICILIFFFISCKKEAKNLDKIQKSNTEINQKKDTINAIQTLKKFYTVFYGTDKFINDDTLLKKYVSAKLFDKINAMTADGENLVLNYDPFIQGQDYDAKTIMKTLEIQPLKTNDEFRVSFLLFGNKDEKKTTIIYQMIKEDGGYKINNILSDNILNPSKTNKIQNGYFQLDNTKTSVGKTNYTVSVLEKNENKNKNNVQHNSNPIVIFRENEKLFENENLVFSYDDNCPADGFQKIVSKNNYFTIEQTYCKDFTFVHSYTTFKIDEKGNVLLHKYGEEYTDRSNPDKEILGTTKTTKDFGTIKFEDATENFLLKLIN